MADNINNDPNYDNNATTNANLKPGEEPATHHDVTEGGVLGAVGGAIVGAIAAGPLAPIGAIVGAVVGGIASAAAVDVVDKHDHDYNRTVSATGNNDPAYSTAATATTTNYDTDYDTTAPAGTITTAGAGYDDTTVSTGYADTATNTGYAAGTRAVGDEVVVPVVEEELAVGKRQVEGGGARIVSSVTETPVEQQVTLREENVTVDRRPVDRAITANDQPFQEGVLEVEEVDEVPVVAKQARVVEEVVVGKTATEHTETIRDTVRRTDVEVEQLDANTGRDLDRDVTTGR